MSAPSFTFRIVTPLKITERQVSHIRLKDETGYFGIMKGHTDFLTVLDPSLCYYTDAAGEEFFLAVDGGVLSMRDGLVSLTSRDIHESDDRAATPMSRIFHPSTAHLGKGGVNF